MRYSFLHRAGRVAGRAGLAGSALLAGCWKASSDLPPASLDLPAHAARPPSALSGLAPTPPMGFNDWNAFGCNVSEQLIRETAQFFVSSGLKDAGYTYVNIDDCWSLRERGADGKLVADPAKFPSGIAGVADFVHGLGLKLGIYGDAGTLTCAGYPGSLGKEELDAQTFADWGVDYLKYDNCSNQSDGSREDFVRRYTAMREALEKTNRPIVYSICEWGQSQPWEWATGVGHLWRTTGDITDAWSSVRSIIQANVALARYAGPGHWNDPDMLEIGNGGMTPLEYRTHMSMWAMMAAPLIIGTDLRTASADTLAILENREIIAIDQDPLGKQARVAFDDGNGVLVLEKPLASGDTAIALYNGTDSQAVVRIPGASTALGKAPGYRLQDVWSGNVTQAAGTIAAGVPAHATVVYKSSALSDAAGLAPAVSVGGTLPILIAGSRRAASLTTVTENHGSGAVSNVAVRASAPQGWVVSAAGASSGASLATDAKLETRWNVQAPAGTPPGGYTIGVSAAYSWGPKQQQLTTATELHATVVVPPSDGSSHVSLLVPISATNAVGPVEVDSSNGGQNLGDGSLITIRGKVYTRGLGTSAGSKLVYHVGGRCSRLTTEVGIDDEIVATGYGAATGVASAGPGTPPGSAIFEILADDRVVAQSRDLTGKDPAQALSADVSGATVVQLVTKPGAAGEGAHADWAAPKIVCGGSTAPTTREQTLFSFETGTEEWTLSNAGAGGSIAPSSAFHTEGTKGLQLTAGGDGNWFGRRLPAPLNLTGKTLLAFDIKTAGTGTSGELAVQVGSAWCQGSRWAWTNPNSSKTIKTAFKELGCPAGTTLDVSRIDAVWVFVKGGTFTIDQVRAE